MRAAIYIRVSSDEQAQAGYSLADQRRACAAHAQTLGASSLVEFADEGVSGSLLERPGLSQLREMARDGDLDLVVISDPDRFSRRLAHQLMITEELERYAVRLEFVNVEFKQSPEGRLFFSLRGAVSEYEREKIRERTSAGRRQKARQGRLPFAMAPYGYRYDHDQSMLVLDEDEAVVIRRIFHALVHDHIGLNGIAKGLTADRVPTKKGAPVWHRQVVRQIARNSVYSGVYWANRRDFTGVYANHYRKRGEKVWGTERDASQWIPVKVPAIVSQDLWDQAQTMMDERTKKRAVSTSPYLLSGLVRCGVCGNTMTGRRMTWWGQPRAMYTCRKNTAGAKSPGCGAVVIAAMLEEAVWTHIAETLRQPERLVELLASTDTQTGIDDELRKATGALQRVERAQHALLDALETGIASLESVTPRLARLKEQERESLTRLAQARAAYDAYHTNRPSREDLLQYARDYVAVLDQVTAVEDRQVIVRELIAQLIVNGDMVTVSIRVPRRSLADPVPVAVPLVGSTHR